MTRLLVARMRYPALLAEVNKPNLDQFKTRSGGKARPFVLIQRERSCISLLEGARRMDWARSSPGKLGWLAKILRPQLDRLAVRSAVGGVVPGVAIAVEGFD